MVDGHARLFHFRSFRNAKDAAMSMEAESAVLFISVRSNGSSATTLLPARYHLSINTTKLCLDARFRTALHAKSRFAWSSFSRDMFIFDAAQSEQPRFFFSSFSILRCRLLQVCHSTAVPLVVQCHELQSSKQACRSSCPAGSTRAGNWNGAPSSRGRCITHRES